MTSLQVASLQPFRKSTLKQKSPVVKLGILFNWSGRRVSNPLPAAWKAAALPNELLPQGLRPFRNLCGGGWTRTTELRRGQIYSLLQLPLCDSPRKKFRADRRTRTADRLITNQLLYQLSYIGTCIYNMSNNYSRVLGLQK